MLFFLFSFVEYGQWISEACSQKSSVSVRLQSVSLGHLGWPPCLNTWSLVSPKGNFWCTMQCYQTKVYMLLAVGIDFEPKKNVHWLFFFVWFGFLFFFVLAGGLVLRICFWGLKDATGRFPDVHMILPFSSIFLALFSSLCFMKQVLWCYLS